MIRSASPSYANGFAHSSGESSSPGSWKVLVGAWVPSLGVTGGTLRDVSGYGADGTLTNMDPATDWVAGEKGFALDFDGLNDEVIIPNQPQIDFTTNSFAYGLTCKLTGNNGTDAVIGKGNPVGPGTTGYGLYYLGTAMRVFIHDGTTRVYFDSSAVYQNEYHSWYVVVDRSSDMMTLYQDGVSIGSADISAIGSVSTSGRFSIGNLVDGDIARYSFLTVTSSFAFGRAIGGPELFRRNRDPLAPFRLRSRIAYAPAVTGVIASGGLSQIMYGTQSGGVGVLQGIQPIESGV